EADVDSLDADDQPARQPVCPRRLEAVDATAAVRAVDEEPDEIGAVGRRSRGPPNDRVRAGRKPPPRAPERLHRTTHLVRGDDAHIDSRGVVEFEADQGSVAKAV